MFFSTSSVCKILGLSAPQENLNFPNLTSDTRAVKPGDLFIALVGETHDGHAFLDQAIAKGARAVIHANDFAPATGSRGPQGVQSFKVKDTLLAYRALAQAWRAQFQYPVVAVGGSAGKTTSKEFLAAILSGKFKPTLKTLGSQNGFTGIPATLFRLSHETRAAVIEIGIDEPHAMEQHLEIVQPIAGLLTSIGPEHLEKLINVENVAKEEKKLFEYLDKHKGIVAINADDPYILAAGNALKGAKSFYYGLNNPKADIKGTISGDQLEVSGLGTFPLLLEGKHNALNLLGALALAHALGLSPQEMRQGLQAFQAPPGRSEVHEWRNNIKVYADTYNANPSSVQAAIEMLTEQAGAKSSWVCLGDMLELGTFEESLHRGLAAPLKAHKIQHVFLFGERMRKLADELKKQNFAGEVQHFQEIEAAAADLSQRVQPGDRILIKGSRGMRMERLWEHLAKTK